MITLEQAIDLYNEKNPTYKIDSILDVGDEWVISALDRKTGLEIDISPLAISKETGDFRVFFPPDNKAKLTDAKEVSLEGLKID